ncbi:hypothetical protein FHR22_003218 [Sphingopyxis panaciterrae]|uniref:hypothetical protein n=1 Tax=Sphingopyxis panaciterrae TaxID=363841 RepID=UPI00142265EE|nr:hypothetical protein [Sphingopyxis panaciterrae]NIJ38507.1 hypothetical protein [Sphingopyxis panaciterrae]
MLASAIADEFAIQAAAQKIAVDHIAVEFTSYPDDPTIEKARKVAYPRNLTYVAYIDSKATDAQLAALRTSVEKTSPVLNLISAGYPIPHGEIILKPSPATHNADLPPGLRDFLVEKRAATNAPPPIRPSPMRCAR